jgi:hypothetical protein
VVPQTIARGTATQFPKQRRSRLSLGVDGRYPGVNLRSGSLVRALPMSSCESERQYSFMTLRILGRMLGRQFDRVTVPADREFRVGVAVVSRGAQFTPESRLAAGSTSRPTAPVGGSLFHAEAFARSKMSSDPRSTDAPSVVANAHCLSIVDDRERGCNHVESR